MTVVIRGYTKKFLQRDGFDQTEGSAGVGPKKSDRPSAQRISAEGFIRVFEDFVTNRAFDWVTIAL